MASGNLSSNAAPLLRGGLSSNFCSGAVLTSFLKNPTSLKSANQAKVLHSQIIKTGGPSTSATAALVSVYSYFNLLGESLDAFHTLQSPPSLAWRSIIKCCTFHGQFSDSLLSFVRMLANGRRPDRKVLPSVLRACALSMEWKFGESVHCCVVRLGLNYDLYTCNALMNLYSKLQSSVSSSSTWSAYQMFDEIPERGSSQINNVRKIFSTIPVKDIVSWNTLIAGYAENGSFDDALMAVREMEYDHIKPDCFTLSTTLPVFAEKVDLGKGKEIHCHALRHGLDNDVFVGSGLIDMYAKCSKIELSKNVFCSLTQLDDISWNSMIAGYVQTGLFDEGLNLFRRMLKSKVKLRKPVFSSVLPACAHFTSLRLGKELHGCIIRAEFNDNLFIASSLVDMYAKCGSIGVARWIFNSMKMHDMVSWTAMIMGYAVHGDPHMAISFFEEMKKEGVKPNSIAFLAVLTACSHAAMADEGWSYFESMADVYQISPRLEHYAAMADLLGRVGRLQEAYEFINGVDFDLPGSVWLALLAACRLHKNVELAEKVAEKIFRVDPENRGTYVLMCNVYSDACRWGDAARLRMLMKKSGMEKKPACSWVEVENKVHIFVAGDKSHSDYEAIEHYVCVLQVLMEHEGYVPDTKLFNTNPD